MSKDYHKVIHYDQIVTKETNSFQNGEQWCECNKQGMRKRGLR